MKDMEKREQMATMEAQSKFSSFSMDLERLRRQFSTVASSKDWKDSNERTEALVLDLKRNLTASQLATERHLDGKMGEDLELSQQWRDEVERNFNAQLKLMDERVAVIQDDVYQIRTGHGLELNELEDRFEEHVKVSEKTFSYVQNDLKRLLKRNNDAHDRLDKHDTEHEEFRETFAAHATHLKEADDRHALTKERHTERIDKLDDEMEERVEEYKKTTAEFLENRDKLVENDERMARNDTRMDGFEMRHDKMDAAEAALNGRVTNIEDVVVPDLKVDIADLNSNAKKLAESTTKNLNKFKTALEKTNTHITNTQKEVRAFDERITQTEEMNVTLKKELKMLMGTLDMSIESVRAEITEVDKKADEIKVVKEVLAEKAELIAECQTQLTTHQSEIEASKAEEQVLEHKIEEAKRKAADELAAKEEFLQGAIDVHQQDIEEIKQEGTQRDKAIFNLGSKVDENERIAEMHRSPESEMKLWVEELVKLCVEFENEAVPQKAPQLSADKAKIIARHSQELAGFFAQQADFSVIKTFICATDVDEMNFEEDAIDEMRHVMTEDFLVGVVQDVQAANARPTKVMLEARAKFKNKLRKAVESALTKYEQVEIANNSRLMGVPLKPACVACDRPLHTRRNVKGGERSQHTGPLQRPATSGAASGSGSRKVMAEGARGDIAGRSGGHPGAYHGGDTRPKGAPGGAGYVYRGGFRMPKGQPDAEVMAGLDVIGGPMRPSKTGGLPSLRGPEV